MLLKKCWLDNEEHNVYANAMPSQSSKRKIKEGWVNML